MPNPSNDSRFVITVDDPNDPIILISTGDTKYQLDIEAIADFLCSVTKTFNIKELPVLIEQIYDSIDTEKPDANAGEILRQLRFMRKVNTLMQFMVEEV